MRSLEINGTKLHRIKYASEQTGYSRDYITRLAREQKIVASQIGRQWFVDLDSLAQYSSSMQLEQKARQQKLSDERKQERQLTELLEKKEISQALYKRRLALRSKLLATTVLSLGLLTGFALEKFSFVPLELNPQVAGIPFLKWLSDDGVQDAPSIKLTTTPAGAEVVDFSQETFNLATMAEPADGVLLLPASQNGSSSPDIKKLFSDEVSVLSDENGQQYVAQVDAKGEVIRKIPFVVVPVNPPPDTP
jgi:hypothetical protein